MQAILAPASRFCVRDIGCRQPTMIRAAQRSCEFLSTFARGSIAFLIMSLSQQVGPRRGFHCKTGTHWVLLLQPYLIRVTFDVWTGPCCDS
jgi:hypothetical protein